MRTFQRGCLVDYFMINQIIVGLLCAATMFASGWMVNGWRLNDKFNAQSVKTLQENQNKLKTLTEERDLLAQKITETNNFYSAKLTKSQHETNNLRDCLRLGTCGLRINALCSDSGQSKTSTATGLDIGKIPVLTPDAETNYFALLDNINTTEIKLSACQDELRLRSE